MEYLLCIFINLQEYKYLKYSISKLDCTFFSMVLLFHISSKSLVVDTWKHKEILITLLK